MFTTKFVTRTIALVTIFMLAFSGVLPVYAAPSNDNFAAATEIPGLSFSVNADTTGATFEAGEPSPSCFGSGWQLKTAWYKYTPATNSTLTARVNYNNFPTMVAVYTGDSVDALTPAGCGLYYNSATFQALANTTYYFQVSGWYDYEGIIPFSLEVTPPPQVFFNYYPSDPNIFDNVGFYSGINDPGGIYGDTYAWTTSDGATSYQGSFYHQFAADGDYTVNLTFTTYDGRSGSASQVVHVRTKDVAITTFSVPQTARVNQTKTINVNVQNKHYSDYVQVTLYKGLPGGGEQVIGTLTIYVPERARQATTFKFSYTFTADDAAVGKVTFRAVANIVNGRDALPSDNTSIATTSVSR